MGVRLEPPSGPPAGRVQVFKFPQKIRRVIERVVAQLVLGGVRDPAGQARVDLHPAPVPEHEPQLTRLAQDDHVGLGGFGKVARAPSPPTSSWTTAVTISVPLMLSAASLAA